jgi:hypothetical protein
MKLENKLKKFEELYDYGSVSKQDKKVVEEIINILSSRENVPNNIVVEEIKHKFGIKQIPIMSIEKTIWHQLTKDEKLGQSIQGYKTIKDKNGNDIKIPHIAFSADLDDLEKIINRILQKIRDLKLI